MIPGEDGKIGDGKTQNHCPGMTSWCIQWPNGTADWRHRQSSKKEEMKINIEGAGDPSSASITFISNPAKWSLYFGRNQSQDTEVYVWYDVSCFPVIIFYAYARSLVTSLRHLHALYILQWSTEE